jgi:GTP-binding protein HflX
MKQRGARRGQPPKERAALVALASRRSTRDDLDTLFDELAGLTAAAGADVVLRAAQDRGAADPATLIGRGKVETVARACEELGVDLIVFDNDLTPAQARNIEKACGRRVIDRTELILAIFARRARTREGQLQVELAQLEYRLPRLAGSSEALSRLGGGIGTRGPGETKLETDRRRIRHRIATLRREIADVARRRGFLRSRRRRIDVPTVALVGYTNAGKSTLFNRLTGAQATSSNALFVTLDPLVRRVAAQSGAEWLLSDTVGFIDRLPHQLVAAFHATLEEVAAADVLLHVIDASAPDYRRQMAAVKAVLEEIGASAVPTIEVYNKVDALTPDARAGLAAAHPSALCISALDAACRDVVIARLAGALAMEGERVRYSLDPDRDRRLVADLYRHARVVSHVAVGARVLIEADVPRRLRGRLRADRVPA